MLQIFRNNSPFTVIILFIAALCLKLNVLLHPIAPMPIQGYLVYNTLLSGINVVLDGNAFGYTLITVVMLFTQALYINNIAVSYKLFNRPTYITAAVFLLLTSLYPPFNYFGITVVVNWLIIGALDIMLSFSQTLIPRKQVFNAGYILSLAALMQFSAAAYLLLLFGALLILRSFNAGEWIVSLLGYTTPLYFFAGILFLTDMFPLLYQWPRTGLSMHMVNHDKIYLSGVVTGLVILIASGIRGMQEHVPKSSIYIRRNWFAIVVYALVAALAGLLTENDIGEAWLAAMPALALIIAYAFNIEKHKRFSNFIFYFSVLLVVFCQVAINR